ncbi:triose-phosphate isomerase [Mycoplasma flocculare]|uniref:Triosephosphate isomerase n=1 Tax=Mesomycoplasma flocculare TaxID=2128 RepID=A0AAW9XCT6_MESFC|nr:triose-phosphate isomerase [Mesomycoplasma flocculare]MXR39306.1 triose-phosphate isomerase [Mycoplasma sp. MF12]MXR05720.1 triose-phosphate isomerase [Mesomycoplasma flocculare]MXR12090.1 triose-phosphate isomerase [Mesomycoplasma flocculare]MXR13351.1 triose-phosphate isomerase [Mesomycoplasma flocculare]MXR22686.1 triose-phosphate isomerase [Mesomycoplasma flocculare]
MKKIIIGNWKMNKTVHETRDFIQKFDIFYSKNLGKIKDNLDFAIAPSFTSLALISTSKIDKLKVAAQNLSQFDSGAFTGEISAKMLQDLAVNYVIIGHSERREIFKEIGEDLTNKILQAQKYNLIPVFCVGESLSEFEANETEKVIIGQINEVKSVLNFEKAIIAYEPIWAIGTGKTATAQIAEQVCKLIKNNFGKNIRVIYGGSVNSKNINELLLQKNIDGALVGKASLDPEEFVKILANI